MPEHRMSATPDRIIVIPALYVGTPDARLSIYSADGEQAAMTLSVGTTIIARGEDFRRPQIGAHTWFDAPQGEVAGTFGAFLAHAVESSEDGARAGWSILSDDASDWTDALAIMEADEQL